MWTFQPKSLVPLTSINCTILITTSVPLAVVTTSITSVVTEVTWGKQLFQSCHMRPSETVVKSPGKIKTTGCQWVISDFMTFSGLLSLNYLIDSSVNLSVFPLQMWLSWKSVPSHSAGGQMFGLDRRSWPTKPVAKCCSSKGAQGSAFYLFHTEPQWKIMGSHRYGWRCASVFRFNVKKDKGNEKKRPCFSAVAWSLCKEDKCPFKGESVRCE